ncbi:hypothetical protein [Salibacterium lacus]|uniref:Lipoprotein n=1 Tax=Salibacterium lacus TaxID=1898109 RepID=A0ABW5T4U5_9BACI
MKQIFFLILCTVTVTVMAACGSNGENAESSAGAEESGAAEEQQEEAENSPEETAASEETDTGSESADSEGTGEDEAGGSADGENYEPYEYEEVWADVGLEVESSKEALQSDYEKLVKALTNEHKQQYDSYVNGVTTAIEAETTIELHYNRFMNNVPDILMDTKRVELETREIDFVRQQLIKGMENMIDAIEPMDTELEGKTAQEALDELNSAIDESNHYDALGHVQLQRILEETGALKPENEDDYLDFIDEQLNEEKL